MLIVAGFLLLVFTTVSRTDDGANDPDIDLDTPHLLKKYGYPAETYEVETEDNYILTMFRLPYGKKSPLNNEKTKPAVLLQHGILSSSDDWVIMGPGLSLAYILADAGYDVWLGNSRGNHYSRKHRFLSPDDHKYWQFSWHENGVYDVPAQIDHILNVTSHSKIYYIRHSMGTTMFYVAMSMKPQYNKNIQAMFSLAPICFVDHMYSPVFKLLAKFEEEEQLLTALIGVDEFTPSEELMKMIGQALCEKEDVTQPLCYNPIFLVEGFDSKLLYKEKLPAILAHVPAGASIRQFLHYGQEIDKGGFQQYSFGPLLNLEIYNSLIPPAYNLTKVSAPIALLCGPNDWLAATEDIDRLYSSLPNPIEKYKVKEEDFNHVDFLWSKRANIYVYDHLIELMNKY